MVGTGTMNETRLSPIPRLWVIPGFLTLCVTCVVGTAWAQGESASSQMDCRFLTTEDPESARRAEPLKTEWLPRDDIFRPILADPKQPQFFASYQTVRFRQASQTINAGSVGFGETFGLWGRRQENGCDGVQVGLLAGVFSQFNLDAPSSDLLNSDFVVGIPVTLRSGPFSARVRLYHQSSHVGDEFLLRNPGFNRLNLSFEEVDAILSYEYGWARIYGGGGYLVDRQPALARGKLQWGTELRGPSRPMPFLGERLGDVRYVPVLGADFKSFEQMGWNVNTSVMGGLEWCSPKARRRFRVLANYYHGFNPYGQFFNQKIQSFGIGLYLAF